MTVAQQVDTGAIAGNAQAPVVVKKPWWEHASLYRYGFVVAILIVWEIIAPFISPIFFTSPSKIAIAFYETTVSGELPYFLAQSLEVMFYGLVTAIVVGIPLGVAMARIRWLDWALDLPINALYATPLVAVVPLLVLWFGIYLKAKIIVVFLFAVFPILINTYQGVRECDKGMIEVAQSFRSSEWRMWQRRAAAVCGALHHRGPAPCHWARSDRHDHRRILHDDFRPGIHDHEIRECFRDG